MSSPIGAQKEANFFHLSKVDCVSVSGARCSFAFAFVFAFAFGLEPAAAAGASFIALASPGLHRSKLRYNTQVSEQVDDDEQ